MMASKTPRVYLDSCYYIDVARGREALPMDPHRKAQLPYVEALLLAAHNGDIEIVASTLVIAECLHVQDKRNIPETTKQTFMNLLTSGVGIRLISVDVFVAERARDLLWVDGITCGGSADTIHVATALDERC